MTGNPILDLPIGGSLVPKEEIKRAAMLKIEVMEGFAVPKNTMLQINACGLINSKRNKGDGCTIIGSQDQNAQGEVFNDFVISSMDVGIGKRHMVIKYSIDTRSYYLRDLGDGSGTFVRLDVSLVSTIVTEVVLDVETWLYNIIWRLSHGRPILSRPSKIGSKSKHKNLT